MIIVVSNICFIDVYLAGQKNNEENLNHLVYTNKPIRSLSVYPRQKREGGRKIGKSKEVQEGRSTILHHHHHHNHLPPSAR